MTMTLDSLLEKANRKLNDPGMNKETADKTRQVIEEMYKLGIYVGIGNPAFRSFAEQNALYAQGRTTPGKKVTNAKGGQSNHNYGVAVDLFQYTEDGSDAIWDETTDGFKKIVAAMKAKGFKWGGDWRGFKDYPHFELYNVVDGEKIKPYNGDSTSVVSQPKTYLEKGDSGDAVKELQSLLNQVGYNVGEVDGEFGDKTDAQVRKFQSDKGLVVDGLAGTATISALKSSIPSPIIGVVRVKVPVLNIRSDAGTQFDVIKKAKEDEKYNVVANLGNGWHQVLIDDKGNKGWMYSNDTEGKDYLELLR